VENLRTSGVETEVVIYEEMIHGFMHMDSVFTEVQDAVEDFYIYKQSYSLVFGAISDK
jgi:acetyl esterase